MFASREFAIGNLTTYLLHGATFAAAFFITQEFQLARGYSPLGTGLRLLPFFATPMIVAPLAGTLSDRIRRRPIMLAGLMLQALGYVWVASRGSLHTSWIELDCALLLAGIGISMALPTVPTTVLDAVAPEEMGKASGINYMAQRLGTVFALAIASAVFAAHGHLGKPAAVTAGPRSGPAPASASWPPSAASPSPRIAARHRHRRGQQSYQPPPERHNKPATAERT
jgi:MFS family permease